ncbi:DUF1016 N-terminal domain-containing protein [Chryseobacterium wanjuense]
MLSNQFNHIVYLIRESRNNALKSVKPRANQSLLEYWEYISNKVESSEWGKSVVEELALHIRETEPEIKGFSDKNLLADETVL